MLKQASWAPPYTQPPALPPSPHHTKYITPYLFSFLSILMSFFSFPSFFMLRSLQAMSPYLSSAYSPLKHPAHPTISDLTCKLQAKPHQQQTKDKLPSHHPACVSPTHHSYPAVVLADSRAQVSAVFSTTRNTYIWVSEELPGRAALPQVSIALPLSLRAYISRWMYFLSLTISPQFAG